MTEIHQPDRAPHTPFEAADGVYVVPLRTPTLPPATHTNCLLLGRGTVVVVDPASPYREEQDRLLGLIEERGCAVQAIWLTHHHADHIGGVTALREALDVPVCAHRATAERLDGQLRIDEELYSGDIGALGGVPVEVIHTPGHARGHLAFGVGPRACLVAGDLVAGQGTIVIDPPEGDMADYLATLGALVQRGVGVVVPAHGPAANDGESLLLKTIAHRLMREEQLLEVLGPQGPQGAYPIDLVPTIYPEVPAMFHPLAARQVLAHLLKLEAEGRAVRLGGGRGVPGQPVYLPSAVAAALPDAAFALTR